MTDLVLIIDKDQTFCQTVAQALEPLGLEIALEYDGETGLAFAEKHRPQLIILSAELQGYSLCRKIRKGQPGEAKIIVTSERADKVFEAHRNREGAADAYMIKPISESEVITQINQLLNLGLNPRLFGGADINNLVDNIGPREVISGMSLDQDQLRQELDAKEQHNNYLKKEMEAYREGYRTLEGNLKDRTDRCEAAENRVRDLELRIADMESLEEQVSDRKSQIKQLEQQINRKDSDLAEAEAERLRLQGELARVGNEFDQLKTKLKGYQQDQSLSLSETEDLRQTLHEQKQRFDERQRQIVQLEADLDELRTQLSAENRAADESRKQADQMRRQFKETENQLEEALQRQGQLQQQLDALSHNQAGRDEHYAQMEKQRERERQENQANLQEIQAMRDELTRVQDRLDDTLREREGLEAELLGLRNQLEGKTGAMAEVEKTLLSLQHHLDEARERYTQTQTALDEANRRLENQESTIGSLETELKRASELDNSFARYKETAQKNLEETSREYKRAMEKLRTEMAEQKASFDDMRASIDRENEGIVRGLKEEIARTRKEAESMVSRHQHEKAEQIEQLRATLKQLKNQCEQAEGEAHARKEEVFSLTKKARQTEELHQAALVKLKAAHEVELRSQAEQAEEERKSLRADFAKEQEERDVKVAAIERSNKEYAAKITQLESKQSQFEKERESERLGLMERIGKLEQGLENANQALAREKEEHHVTSTRFFDREREFKQQEESLQKLLAEEKRRHQQELSGEKNRQEVLQDRIAKLEMALEDLSEIKRENEDLGRELDKLRMGHELLKSRQNAAKAILQAGLMELQGTSESLELELED